jgi:hypothetical protein
MPRHIAEEEERSANRLTSRRLRRLALLTIPLVLLSVLSPAAASAASTQIDHSQVHCWK